MKDDAPLCGCTPCRQTALNSLRCEIKRKEGALRRSKTAQDALMASAKALADEDKQYALDCDSVAVEMRYASMGDETIIAELKALEQWLSSFESIPELAEQALWRLIGRNPHVPF